jgi:hypothetical protein
LLRSVEKKAILDVLQGTRSVDSRSPWHATPLPLPTLTGKLDNSPIYFPLAEKKLTFQTNTDLVVFENAKMIPIQPAVRTLFPHRTCSA